MTAVSVPTQALPGRRNPALGWLRARPRLVFGGLAVALLLAGTFGRPWLEALGIGSAVLSLLPCAAKQGGAGGSAEANVPPAPCISTST